MKEAIVHPGPLVKVIDSPVPSPGPGQVLIKVIISGSNPKDWKHPESRKKSLNSGDDIAGVIERVGDHVTEFKPGDRVASFHEMEAPYGSFAEYAVSWAATTFHLPAHTSFEEAATIPLAAMTSAIGLYQSLGLPEPWHPAAEPLPLIVYGASSAVGSFAIKLARLSNIHPIIAIAGRAQTYVQELLDPSQGDAVLDHRQGDTALVEGIREALKKAGHGPARHALDAVSGQGSTTTLAKALEPTGAITTVLPVMLPPPTRVSMTYVGTVHNGDNKDFAFVFYRYFGHGLGQGVFHGHPFQVVPHGLGGVQQALQDLKDGKASAVKYVFRISDTPGAGAE